MLPEAPKRSPEGGVDVGGAMASPLPIGVCCLHPIAKLGPLGVQAATGAWLSPRRLGVCSPTGT